MHPFKTDIYLSMNLATLLKDLAPLTGKYILTDTVCMLLAVRISSSIHCDHVLYHLCFHRDESCCRMIYKEQLTIATNYRKLLILIW